jgi:hypothetical protein
LAPESAAFSLLDALSEGGFQSSVIGTYCCYFPFYEEVVLRRLLNRGCTNNVLMVDARLCAQAFADEQARPRRAGRDYTLVPIDLDGAFHPKLIVMLGKSKGTLFVGSHNATLAGFGLNDEIANEFRTSGSVARQGAGVIRIALDYLQSFAPKVLADVAQVFNAARRNVPWLEGPMAVESDEERILLSTTGRGPDLWSRIRPLVPKRPSLTFVCGPFFDNKLEFLHQLIDDVKPRRLVVGIDPESVDIDPHAVRRFRGAEFVNVAGLAQVPNRREAGARYFHAKILWFSGAEGELLVTGSANPSKAAFLSGRDRRNAEAIVVDRRVGAATALGLDRLVSAPKLHDKDWAQVARRQAERPEDERDASGTVILAVPSDDCFELERSLDAQVALDAFAADGTPLGQTTTRPSDPAIVEAPPEIRDRAQTLRGLGPGKKPVVVLIHRPDEVAKYVGGDRQRELQQALGALEEDPAQLDTLLKLTEKVIFESDDIVRAEPPMQAKTGKKDREDAATGPETFAVDAAGRRTARKKKRLASGDILVLLDALMYRLGEGLSGPAAPRPPIEEVQPVSEDDAGEEEPPPPPPPPPYEILAETCRAKVGRLIRRMNKQLEAAPAAKARRAVVQLAAVLSVVHTLRIMEQRIEWRSKHLKLVDNDHEWLLFETAGLATAWGGSALGPRAVSEAGGEPFQELSLAIGLLSWLAWEVEIDVKAAVERTSPINLEEEDAPWHGIQVFAAVAAHLSADQDARETLTAAVTRTARIGANASTWIKTHLAVADRLAGVMSAPGRVAKPPRPPMPGDMIVLGPDFDPRVRIALEVAPSGASDKITVLDRHHENGQRQFLASYVRYAALFEQEPASNRLTAS